MNNETYDKQSEALAQIADIATAAGLILGWDSHHPRMGFMYFEGDWEEGDIDMESVDRMNITRSVNEEGEENDFE